MELLKDIKDLFRPVLSDRQIKKYMEKGLLIEDPITESQLQPNSVDLTLANTWSKLNHNRVVIDKYMTPPPGEHTSEPETIDVPIMEKDGVTHHRVTYPMHSISIRSANEVETRPIDLRIPLSYTSGEFIDKPVDDVLSLAPIEGIDTTTNPAWFKLEPGEFCLMASKEVLNIPNGIISFVQGRSSIARVGIQTEQAGLIDAGFRGTITFEVFNQTKYPIILYEGMRIAQVYFFKAGYAERLYGSQGHGSKYNGQIKPTGSRICNDREFAPYVTKNK